MKKLLTLPNLLAAAAGLTFGITQSPGTVAIGIVVLGAAALALRRIAAL